MPYLTLRHLTKRFDGNVAVKDVSLEIERKEFLTLLGPSGCGKTTTLRLIAGLTKPDDGEIAVGGRTLVSTSEGIFVPAAKRGMGMVFQSYAVWPHMTVFNNIAYGLKIKKMPREEIRTKVRQALEMVRLAGFEDRYPPQLSGGEQQRVAVARALVTQPDILLFDEPLSNLDAKLREEMRFEIKEIQRKVGITAVYVTHDQAESMVISDRIAVMGTGEIHQVGTPYAIYKTPQDQFVAGFIGLTNFIKGEANPGQDHARISSELGVDFVCKTKASLTVGQKVLVSVRPEDFEILREEPPIRTNLIRGRISRKAYLGSLIDYKIDVDGQFLRAQAKPTTILEEGSRVFLQFRPSDCTVVPL